MDERNRETKKGDRIAFLVRLADGLAHEIKNPLSTMTITLGLLREDFEDAVRKCKEYITAGDIIQVKRRHHVHHIRQWHTMS